MTVPKIRVRTRKPKTTTGCRTCRIRRIKCDETRPDCEKCSSTGRACEWFDRSVTGGNNRSQAISLSQSKAGDDRPYIVAKPWYAPLSCLSPVEGQAFTFFRHHTAGQLHGTFQSRLWTSWALQLSHREPAVMHAIIAVGSMHEARSAFEHPLTAGLDPESKHFFAVQQYCKAIARLQANLKTQTDAIDIDVALLVCLLFVGFELLRAKVETAMEHLDSGLRIAIERFGGAVKAYAGQSMAMKSTSLIDELVPAFARLDYASTMFGQRYPQLDFSRMNCYSGSSLEPPGCFQTIEEAKSYLSVLANAVFRLRGDLLKIAEKAVDYPPHVRRDLNYRECYLNAFVQSVSLDRHQTGIIPWKLSLEQELARFGDAFERFIHAHKKASDRSAMAIQIEYIHLCVLVTHCRNTYESAYDGCNEKFRKGIDLATMYMESAPRGSESQPKRAFALEPGVLPTVFLVAEKCRDLHTRQKAIELMRDGCAQEAMWDGKPYATFMQRLGDIESRNSRVDVDHDESKHLHAMAPLKMHSSIPESHRYCAVVYVGDACSSEPAKLVCARRRHESDGLIEITEHEVDVKADATYLREICYGRM